MESVRQCKTWHSIQVPREHVAESQAELNCLVKISPVAHPRITLAFAVNAADYLNHRSSYVRNKEDLHQLFGISQQAQYNNYRRWVGFSSLFSNM
jgi:uncharacterized Zn-finger protein